MNVVSEGLVFLVQLHLYIRLTLVLNLFHYVIFIFSTFLFVCAVFECVPKHYISMFFIRYVWYYNRTRVGSTLRNKHDKK